MKWILIAAIFLTLLSSVLADESGVLNGINYDSKQAIIFSAEYMGKIRYAYILTDSLTLWRRGD